jgi:hypothetical protein
VTKQLKLRLALRFNEGVLYGLQCEVLTLTLHWLVLRRSALSARNKTPEISVALICSSVSFRQFEGPNGLTF